MVQEYKKTILAVLNRGICVRRRELAYHCGCWVASPDLTEAIHELLDEGQIFRGVHCDPAGCDTYDYYFTVEEG